MFENWGKCKQAVFIMHLSVVPDGKSCRGSPISCSESRSVLSLSATANTVGGDHHCTLPSIKISATHDSFLKVLT